MVPEAQSNTIMLFLDNHIKWGSGLIDDSIDFKELIKNPFFGVGAEMLDGPLSKVLLGGFNKKVSPYVPDEFKDEIHAVLDDVIDGDDNYQAAISNAIDILDQLKDKIPNLHPLLKTVLDSIIDLMKIALLTDLHE